MVITELMIGDLVSYKDINGVVKQGKILIIDANDNTVVLQDNTRKHLIEDILPTEVTKETLIEYGFQNAIADILSYSKHLFYDDNMYVKLNDADNYWYCANGCSKLYGGVLKNVFAKFKYIHELQHIMRLRYNNEITIFQK